MNYFSNILKLRNPSSNISKSSNTMILLMILFSEFLLLAILLGSHFFGSRNLMSMGFQIPEFGFLAIAMSIAMLSGGIDLSIVSTMNLSGILGAYVLTNQNLISSLGVFPVILLGVIVILLASVVCGAFNGLLIAKVGVPPILATLGTMMFYSGIGMAITGGNGIVGFPDAFQIFGNARILGFPIPLIMIITAFVVMSIVLNKTVWGNSLYFVGGNKVASLFSGIKINYVLIKTYMIAGFMSGCSAIILMSRVNSIKVGYGDTYQLQAILVAVLGGINPDGGSGRLTNVFIGILILQSLQSAFTLFTFSPYAKKLIWGVMLLVVMIINYYHFQKRLKG